MYFLTNHTVERQGSIRSDAEDPFVRLYATVVPYLLLVTFYTGQLSDFTAEKIRVINESPYDGIAVPLVGPYDTNHHALDEFDSSFSKVRKSLTKAVWPWVYFNRFMNYHKEGTALYSHAADKEQFRMIRGMDLANETGALEDFYLLWRIALRNARKAGSPGILIDHEAYNNYKNYSLSYVAQQQAIPESQVIVKLQDIGARMIDIAQKEYPDAVLWFLSTGLITPDTPQSAKREAKYRTITHIVLGMLERAKSLGSRHTIISGGESSLGYCYRSIQDLQDTVKDRDRKYAPFLAKYPNLALGATIAPWKDTSQKTGWMKTREKCIQSTLKNADDFTPMYQYLLEHYGYVWIYAAMVAPYNPYDASSAREYNRTLKQARVASERMPK